MPYIIFKGPTINGALHSLASATGRQKGSVRKSLDKQKWSARFQFQKDTTRVTMDGPPRAKRVDAEKDRQCVVVVLQRGYRTIEPFVIQQCHENTFRAKTYEPLPFDYIVQFSSTRQY